MARAPWLAIAIVAGIGGGAAASPMLELADDPHPGIHRERWYDAAVPARIHLIRVDLSFGEIAVYTTAEIDKGITPVAFASRMGAQVAINGDFFAASSFTPRGLASGNATPWGQTADTAQSATLRIARVGERTVAAIDPPELVIATADLPPETQGVVSGRPLLVRAGVVTPPSCDDAETLACNRAPRSAVALSGDGNTMWLAVVDGWQSGSIGLTGTELGGFLAGRGARDAMGLDVGGSSALVLDGSPISSPSDGVVRPVANHLAVRYGMLPAGGLTGLICLRSYFDCDTKIEGALVRLDDGRTYTTGPSGGYLFADITPRYACVDVTADGYSPGHRCRQVVAGQELYLSVALFPEGEVIDAGPRPDSGFGVGPDAEGTGGGGGCCDAGGDPRGVVVIALLVWAIVLRRP